MLRLKDGFKGERALVLPPYIIDRMRADELLSALYITDIGYYPKAAHHYRKRTQAIQQYVLIYCIDGKGTYRIGSDGVHQTLETNQYVILPAGFEHEYGSAKDTPWTIYWLHFAGTLAPFYAQNADTPHSIQPGINSRISNRITIFEEIFKVLSEGLVDENLHYSASLLHHFLGTLRYIQPYRDAETEQKNTGFIEAVKHFMAENIERHITLQQLADYIGMSASHLSMRFRQQTGNSPIQYLNKLRVEKAAEMLRESDMQINQISYKVGFEDPLYFSRMFSKTMKLSPKEYRKNLQSSTRTGSANT